MPDSTNVTVMNADGTNLTRLTFDDGDGPPSWSPDGTKIAYTRLVGGTGPGVELWVVNADGTSPHAAFPPDSLRGARNLRWTRAGYFLGADLTGIMRINADGTGYARVWVLNFGGSFAPARDLRLSPDGTRVAFTFGIPEGISVAAVNGSFLHGVAIGCSDPVWSPDNSAIAYRDPVGALWMVNPDGTNFRRVTMDGAEVPTNVIPGSWK